MKYNDQILKIAYLPANKQHYNPEYDYSRDISKWFPYAKAYLERYNIIFDVIDAFKMWDDIDLFIFCNIYEYQYKYYLRILKMGLVNRCVYWAAEPDTVLWWNTPKFVPKIKDFFHYVASNKEPIYSIDKTRLVVPELFDLCINESKIKFVNKKLLCNISGNKSSNNKDELYSERKRVIRWFSDNHPEDFGLYGYDWSEFPNVNKGKCEDKMTVYHEYKFALCLENSKMNDIGSVTEKIFDCIRNGVVPIYDGYREISQFVPVKSYIPYCRFKSISDLYEFISDMPESKYNEYLLAAKEYLESGDYCPFDLNTFRQDLINLERLVKTGSWNITNFAKIELNIWYCCYKFRKRCLEIYAKSNYAKKIWRSLKYKKINLK